MGTRSIVAEPHGDGFRGRYVHWDGYPSGVGASLFEAYRTRFEGDHEAMTLYLIDEEPVGWSVLAGIDWTLPKGWHDSHGPESPCADCTLPLWRHYAQCYPEGGPDDPMVNGKRRFGLIHPDEVLQLGHGHREVPTPTGPQSYSARGETGEQMLYSDGDDGGTEWAYVITPRALFVFERRWDDGEHMTGMFGMGADADQGHWAPVAEVSWDSAPDWAALDAGAQVSA